MITTQKIYQMLENETLWETAVRCDQILASAAIPYSVCGGVGVCLHGYQRNTVDLNLVIQSADLNQVRRQLEENDFQWNEQQAEFRTPNGVAVRFLIAGDRAGKDSKVRISPPIGDDNVEVREGVSVVRLSRLIEMKIACGLSNLRRTHKDFADVVELIAVRKLDKSFAGLIHKSLRPTFRQLVDHAHAE